jgi:hypothetical protein
LAIDSRLPLHRGYHGPDYRNAVARELDLLDAAMQKGTSLTSLLNRVNKIEKSLTGRLLNGDLWLNDSDARIRNIGPYKND